MSPSPGGKTEAQRGRKSSQGHTSLNDNSGKQGRTRLPASQDILCPPQGRDCVLALLPFVFSAPAELSFVSHCLFFF